MARLSKAARAALPHDKAHFLNPSKAPGPGSYPIPDAEHRVIAKGLAAMHGNTSMEAKADTAIRQHGGKTHDGTQRTDVHPGHKPAHHDGSTYEHSGHQLGAGSHGLKHHGEKMC